MKIAFVGDSFCANTELNAWPKIVAKEFNAEILTIGRAGGCLYNSYEDLLDVVDEADYTIFCITGPHRLTNRHRLPLFPGNLSVSEKKLSRVKNLDYAIKYGLPIKEIKKIVKAAHDYFEILYDPNFHDISQHGILKIVDELMIKQKKKCIWFACFENSIANHLRTHHSPHIRSARFIPKSGLLADTVLYDISYNELISQGMTEDEASCFDGATDRRRNHFNAENNRNMARLIIDTIENDNFKPKEIKMKDYFKVLR